jgi:hypothetical protein
MTIYTILVIRDGLDLLIHILKKLFLTKLIDYIYYFMIVKWRKKLKYEWKKSQQKEIIHPSLYLTDIEKVDLFLQILFNVNEQIYDLQELKGQFVQIILKGHLMWFNNSKRLQND